MKKLLILILGLSLSLSSCAYHKITQVEVTGKDLSVPIGGFLPAHGEGVKAEIIRQVAWSCWGEPIKELSVIPMSSEYTTEVAE